ncbi:hypothetical protein Q7F05_19400 [Pseudomonas sp. Lb2C1-1]|uniref:hypothetical protein n=1 Tax=Pseudomonas TaxID=286 RepID=UPI003919F218
MNAATTPADIRKLLRFIKKPACVKRLNYDTTNAAGYGFAHIISCHHFMDVGLAGSQLDHRPVAVVDDGDNSLGMRFISTSA